MKFIELCKAMRDQLFYTSLKVGELKRIFSHNKIFKTKFENIFLITGDKLSKIFGNNVLIIPKSKFYNKPRVLKSLICSLLLFNNFKNKDILIFRFSQTFSTLYQKYKLKINY